MSCHPKCMPIATFTCLPRLGKSYLSVKPILRCREKVEKRSSHCFRRRGFCRANNKFAVWPCLAVVMAWLIACGQGPVSMNPAENLSPNTAPSASVDANTITQADVNTTLFRSQGSPVIVTLPASFGFYVWTVAQTPLGKPLRSEEVTKQRGVEGISGSSTVVTYTWNTAEAPAGSYPLLFTLAPPANSYPYNIYPYLYTPPQLPDPADAQYFAVTILLSDGGG